MTTKPKRRGDRQDGYLVRSADPMHVIMPFILGERIENEAVLYETVDMTKVDELLKKKNDASPQYKYTYFHIIVAALAKTIYFRPKMNRYIAGHRYYDRDNISFTFTVKNKFSDHSDESLIILTAEDNGTEILQQVHDKICAEAYKIKEEGIADGTTNTLGWLTKIPRPILKVVVKLFFWMNYHDLLPKAINNIDPYRSTVFITNLGSIKTQAQYHHLSNWSKNSIFVIANKVKKTPVFADDGSYEMKNTMGIGVTVDERIADGFYFARSIELFKYILANPEVLDQPISTPVDFQVEYK